MRRGYLTPPVLIFLALVSLFVAATIFLHSLLVKSAKTQPSPVSSSTPLASQKDEKVNMEPYSINKTTGWKIYQNDEFDFEIEFPPDFEIEKSKDRVFFLENTKTREVKQRFYIPSNFIYILIIPDNLSSEAIYTYDPKENEVLNSMEIGEIKSVKENISEGWTYKRLSDISIGGILAKVFKNNRPWEGAQGSFSKKIHLRKDGSLFIIEGLLEGDLFQGERKEMKISEPLFNQILSTFKFLD